jgi:hypothetical protein
LPSLDPARLHDVDKHLLELATRILGAVPASGDNSAGTFTYEQARRRFTGFFVARFFLGMIISPLYAEGFVRLVRNRSRGKTATTWGGKNNSLSPDHSFVLGVRVKQCFEPTLVRFWRELARL